MTISRLMVYSQQFEHARAKRRSRDAKREKSYDGCSSKSSLEIQDNPTFNKRVSKQFCFKLPKARDNRVSNTKAKKRKGTSSTTKKHTCSKCRKGHLSNV